MAGVEVKVDARQALAKFSPAGIPDAVRRNLRRLLPDLTRAMGDSVESKLSSELKSRNTLTVKKELVENPTAIYGRVRLESPSAKGLLPTYLEEGTQPHIIRGNPFLSFYWEKIGKQMVLPYVNHPGTKPYQFMQRSFDEMRDEVVAKLEDGVRVAAQKAGAGV